VGITLNLIKYLKTWDKSYKKKLEAPKVPAFIVSLFKKKGLILSHNSANLASL